MLFLDNSPLWVWLSNNWNKTGNGLSMSICCHHYHCLLPKYPTPFPEKILFFVSYYRTKNICVNALQQPTWWTCPPTQGIIANLKPLNKYNLHLNVMCALHVYYTKYELIVVSLKLSLTKSTQQWAFTRSVPITAGQVHSPTPPNILLNINLAEEKVIERSRL